jgi:formylglycine-generating enzyme required for sulfatase activity
MSRTVNLTHKVFNLPNHGGTLELIAIPAGTLVMEGGHRVNLKPFLMGKYPVTQQQYQGVMGHNPSRFQDHLDRPVEQVTWYDALAFCQKLSQLLQEAFDLPSETQWEWAARGATKSKGYIYAGSNHLDEVGWHWDNSDYTTHSVGKKKPNELGLYDMSGNVWEWCKDNWVENINILHQDGEALTQSGDSSTHVLRGGSWHNLVSNSAVSFRNSSDTKDNGIGFRVVLH